MNNTILLFARILLAQVFLLAGLGKLGENYAATQSFMESMGTPALLLPVVLILEIGGGLALILGLFSRWAALTLAGFSIISAIIFHNNFADQTQMVMFMKNFAMAGGLLLLYANGPGAYSLDSKLLGRDVN